MRADHFIAAGALRGPERRVIECLRAFADGPEAQQEFWNDLCRTLGANRARGCLMAFEEMQALLRRYGWHAPMVLPPDALGFTEDEMALARFTLAATEQRRDVALEEASFLVTPLGLLPLLQAAARFGLPLLCEDCKARIYNRA